MSLVVDFTGKNCFTCDKAWGECSPSERAQWEREKSHQAGTTSSASNRVPHKTSIPSASKLVSDAQRGTGCTPVRAISDKASSSISKQPLAPGYTRSHGNFQREMERNKKKASGVVGTSTTTVQVKVTVVCPVTKPKKVSCTPVNEDLWATFSVPADIGEEDLRQICVEKLRPIWDRWSHFYPLDVNDATLYADVPGGNRLIEKDRCIFDLFLKKARGLTAVPKYDFSLVLEILFHLLGSFYESVEGHRLRKESGVESVVASVEGFTNTATVTRRIKNPGFTALPTSARSTMRVTSSRPRPRPNLQHVYSNADAIATTGIHGTDQVMRDSTRTLEKLLSNLSLDDTPQLNPSLKIIERKRKASCSSADHQEEESPRKASRTLYVASPGKLRAAFRSQGSGHDHFRQFEVLFQIIPAREWLEEVLSNELNFMNLRWIEGNLEINLKILEDLKGTFKTAHPGQILFPAEDIPNCFSQKICVKQLYWQKTVGGPISRYRGDEEYRKLVKELICLDWATILLNLTYKFIEVAIEEYGEPCGGIPRLRFVRTMLAKDTRNNRHFLIEEWLGESPSFIKYINNGHPVSCVRVNSPKEAHKIAEFLSFAQHIQYNQTNGLAYTSDYQGSGDMLTDPQIISDPGLGPIFGDGNSSKGISRFRVEHDCSNPFCRHFKLTFPDVAEIN